jgi:hypothetical protein
MKQGQQQRKPRGRGRKSQGQTRNIESSGPEVKIRGTASHIADKYETMARDAAASGDTIKAESLLQHAEHYNRIIMQQQERRESENEAATNKRPRENTNRPAPGKRDTAATVPKERSRGNTVAATDAGEAKPVHVDKEPKEEVRKNPVRRSKKDGRDIADDAASGAINAVT